MILAARLHFDHPYSLLNSVDVSGRCYGPPGLYEILISPPGSGDQPVGKAGDGEWLPWVCQMCH